MYSSIIWCTTIIKISEFQHGFCRQRSCESQLLLTIHDIFNTSLEASEQMDTVVLDFSKAFDKVPHNRLLAFINEIRALRNMWTCFGLVGEFLSDRT